MRETSRGAVRRWLFDGYVRRDSLALKAYTVRRQGQLPVSMTLMSRARFSVQCPRQPVVAELTNVQAVAGLALQ
jgi:hypothetical protein